MQADVSGDILLMLVNYFEKIKRHYGSVHYMIVYTLVAIGFWSCWHYLIISSLTIFCCFCCVCV